MITMTIYYKMNSGWVLLRNAEELFKDKQFVDSISLFHRSFEKGIQPAESMIHLAIAYEAIGAFPRAIEWYRTYLTLYPENKKIRLAYAKALTWNGNYEEAEKEYEIILRNKHEKTEKL